MSNHECAMMNIPCNGRNLSSLIHFLTHYFDLTEFREIEVSFLLKGGNHLQGILLLLSPSLPISPDHSLPIVSEYLLILPSMQQSSLDQQHWKRQEEEELSWVQMLMVWLDLLPLDEQELPEEEEGIEGEEKERRVGGRGMSTLGVGATGFFTAGVAAELLLTEWLDEVRVGTAEREKREKSERGEGGGRRLTSWSGNIDWSHRHSRCTRSSSHWYSLSSFGKILSTTIYD